MPHRNIFRWSKTSSDLNKAVMSDYNTNHELGNGCTESLQILDLIITSEGEVNQVSVDEKNSCEKYYHAESKTDDLLNTTLKNHANVIRANNLPLKEKFKSNTGKEDSTGPCISLDETDSTPFRVQFSSNSFRSKNDPQKWGPRNQLIWLYWLKHVVYSKYCLPIFAILVLVFLRLSDITFHFSYFHVFIVLLLFLLYHISKIVYSLHTLYNISNLQSR